MVKFTNANDTFPVISMRSSL